MPDRRSVASLCTLDLLTPNFCAAVRTVQPVSAIYAPIFFDLSLIYSCIKSPPGRFYHVYELSGGLIRFFAVLRPCSFSR